MVMDLDIIIPTLYKNNLLPLLKSIKSSKQNKFNINVILIVNSKSDKLIQQVKSDVKNFNLNVIINQESKKGVNFARNLGIQKSTSSFILFLDDDCIVSSENYFENIISLINKHSNIDIFGGKYINSTKISTLASFYNNLCNEWIYQNRIGENHYHLLGGCLLGRTEVFKKNLFNTEITYGASETELLYRLHKKNYKMLYSNKLDVIHAPNISLLKFIHKAKQQGFNTRKFKLETFPKRKLILNTNKKQYSFIDKLYHKLYLYFFQKQQEQ